MLGALASPFRMRAALPLLSCVTFTGSLGTPALSSPGHACARHECTWARSPNRGENWRASLGSVRTRTLWFREGARCFSEPGEAHGLLQLQTTHRRILRATILGVSCRSLPFESLRPPSTRTRSSPEASLRRPSMHAVGSSPGWRRAFARRSTGESTGRRARPQRRRATPDLRAPQAPHGHPWRFPDTPSSLYAEDTAAGEPRASSKSQDLSPSLGPAKGRAAWEIKGAFHRRAASFDRVQSASAR